jgi:adenosine deaminase
MLYSPQSRLKDFLRSLPKTETHLHIEGALPWELLNDLDPQRFDQPPSSWGPQFKFTDFAEFERDLLEMAFAWYTSPERYHEAATKIFDKLLKEENVRYLETSFASGMIEFLGLDGKAVAEAIKAAAPEGLEVRVFMGIHHDGYTDRSRAFIDDCMNWEALDGLDLHGTETTPLEAWTAEVWQRARDAGKVTKAHAGEFEGPEFVRQVVEELGVTRIQHGVRSIESPKLVQDLRERGVVLDVCPISNVKLGVVERMSDHPIRDLVKEGITCTISTDDPISFGNTLTDEYTALFQELGFDFADLGDLARNGFRNALDGEDAFARHIREIEDLVAAFANPE